MLGLAGRRREARCAIVILLKCGGPPMMARGSVQVEVKLGEASDSLGKGQLNMADFFTARCMNSSMEVRTCCTAVCMPHGHAHAHMQS